MDEAGDGGHIRRGPSREKVGDGLPVHSGAGGGRALAQAPVVQDQREGACDVADRFGGRVDARLFGPGFRIVGQLPGGACAGASADHARAILSVAVDQLWNGCLSSRYAWTVVLDPVTSAKITRYRPKSVPPVWAQVAPLVRSIVSAAVTAVPYDAERLLHVVGRLALWAEAAGIERYQSAHPLHPAADHRNPRHRDHS